MKKTDICPKCKLNPKKFRNGKKANYCSNCYTIINRENSRKYRQTRWENLRLGLKDSKLCAKCKISPRKEGNYTQCKECLSALTDNWRKNNPEKHKNVVLKTKYKITLTQYNSLLGAQNNKCAICSETTKFVVDHNHTTGAVRGLLCSLCNSAIGFLKDNPELLRKAAEYLERL